MNLPFLRVLAAFALFLSLASAAYGQDNCPRPRTISVTGTAEIRVAPDQAVLTLAVESHDRDLKIAKTQNDARAKKVLAVAHDAGVDAKDIQTSALSMGPNYSEEKVPRLLGYDVSQTITMTLKDLSKYEALMTSLLEAGVNRVDGIQFVVAEPRKYRDEARTKAIRAAREKATAMAAELGQAIGKPWEIEEQSAEDPYLMGSMRTRSSNSFSYAKLAMPNETGETSIASGRATIRAAVRITFLLE